MAKTYNSSRATTMAELNANLPLIARAQIFFSHHRVLAFLIIAAIVCVLGALSLTTQTEEAEAAIPIFAVGAAAIGGLILGSYAIDEVGDTVSAGLRDAVNAILDTTQVMIASITTSDGLLSSFDELIEEAYPILQSVFNTVVIPISYVVLAIFLTVALLRIFQTMGQNDAGIDTWKILLIFFTFAFAKIVVDNSWYLLVGTYELFNQLIEGILTSANMSGSFTASHLEDDFSNVGLLILCIIVVGLAFIIAFVVVTITHFVLIVRAIQVYTYTCFAPIPLACMVSDSGKPIATGFIKSYIAVLFSGAIIALLISMFAYIGGTIAIETSPTDGNSTIQWCVEILLNLVVYLAFAWAMWRSGSWAREFVGLAG